jgi:hypothetical protein
MWNPVDDVTRDYSSRSEVTGSARAARAAGRVPARNAMAITIRTMTAIDAGSKAIRVRPGFCCRQTMWCSTRASNGCPIY